MPLLRPFVKFAVLTLLCPFVLLTRAKAQSNKHPWMNTSLSPDERASMVVKEMTLDEKVSLLHGTGMEGLSPMSQLAIHSNGGAGYTTLHAVERHWRDSRLTKIFEGTSEIQKRIISDRLLGRGRN